MASQQPKMPPVIGNWYQSIEQNLYFEVVAIDTLAGTIDIQLLDGEVTEFDFDGWNEMMITPAQPPEDATAAYGLSSEDRWMDESAVHPYSWDNPLSDIEPDQFPAIEDF